MRHAVVIVCVMLVALAGVLACSTRLVRYEDGGKGFAIAMPENWPTQQGVMNSDVSTTVTDDRFDAVVLIAARVWEMGEARTLDIFFRQRINAYLIEHRELAMLEEGQIEIDGRPAMFAILGGEIDDQQVMAVHYYGLAGKRAFLVAGQVVSPKQASKAFAAYKDTFVRVAKSLRMLPME